MRRDCHGTVWTFDRTSQTGSVLTDAGTVVTFGRDAFDRSGLLRLRPGQRVQMLVEDPPTGSRTDDREARGPVAVFLTLPTFQT